MKEVLREYEKAVELVRASAYEEALPLLEKILAAAQLDFGRLEHCRMLAGFVCGEMGKWEEAIPHFRQAMVNDIECLPAYTALGHAYLMAGRIPEAVETFRVAVQKDPANPQARHGLAWSLLEEERNLDEALYQAQEALRLDPQSAAVRDTVGWVLYRVGDLEAAMEQLDEAVRLNPDHPVILQHWREVRKEVKRRKEESGKEK
ncbi:MAG: hypothetical protein D6679_07035 [Candidatus Hydrogenedentota bacterium]|nr:MAG: hypothetical protein D6679_07035 [Candidatus Hydrogenedentota bacterium]